MKRETGFRKTGNSVTIFSICTFLTSLIRKFLFLIFFTIFHFQGTGSILLTSPPDETTKLIAAGIRAGDANEVSKYFNAMVDLIIPGYNDTYAKNQAGQILKEFFSRNPVKHFKVTKQGSSENGSLYAIGELLSGKIEYRVYFLMQTIDGKNLIQQLKIEDNSSSQP